MIVKKFYDKEKAIAYAKKLVEEGQEGEISVREVDFHADFVNDRGERQGCEGWKQYRVCIDFKPEDVWE